jgi:hypothetical protein
MYCGIGFSDLNQGLYISNSTFSHGSFLGMAEDYLK